jgi:hypothetical protein
MVSFGVAVSWEAVGVVQADRASGCRGGSLEVMATE